MAAESAPVVGLFIPGVLILTALGAMTGSGVWPFWMIYAGAVAGALLGDQLGYWLGRFGASEGTGGFLRHRRKRIVETARRLVKEHGVLAIFLGRMAWVIHPAIPPAAGFLGLKSRTFLLVDIPTVCLWVLLYLGLGHVATGVLIHRTFALLEIGSVLLIALVIVLLVHQASGGFRHR